MNCIRNRFACATVETKRRVSKSIDRAMSHNTRLKLFEGRRVVAVGWDRKNRTVGAIEQSQSPADAAGKQIIARTANFGLGRHRRDLTCCRSRTLNES
jgi:hypothetical protein